jgi:hypothetical protein
MRAQSVSSAVRARVARRDLRLQLVRPGRAAVRVRGLQRRQAAAKQDLVPPTAVLIGQQHRFARSTDARAGSRCVQLHQRDQSMRLGLVGRETGEDPSQAQRLLAQRGPHVVVTGAGGVALVEDQVDHLEHRRQARHAVGAARHLERHARFGQRPLGAHDSLRDRRLAGQESARDLVGRKSAQEAQRQRDPRLARQHGVAGHEDQAQEVIADVVVETVDDPLHRLGSFALVLRVERVPQLLVLARQQRPAPQVVDRVVLGRRHQPCARVVGHARGRPLLESCDQRVLRQLLGDADVAHHAREPGDQPRRFDAPDRVDRPPSLVVSDG